MSESINLKMAELQELDAKFEQKIGNPIAVQFNPETLKVNFANQISTPNKTGDQKDESTQQFVGAGTTKLAVQLWFDVTAPIPENLKKKAQTTSGKEGPIDDVRRLTQEVAYFITPKKNDENQFIPPAMRFLWGTFQFDGIVESMEESIEFFSNDGRPLRASVSLSLSQQRITEFSFGEKGENNLPTGEQAGTRPLTQASSGDTLQGMTDQLGGANDWQSIASANNIENPRLLTPGQLIDMKAGAGISAGIGANAGVDLGVSVDVGIDANIGIDAVIDAGVVTSIDAGIDAGVDAGISAGIDVSTRLS